MTGRRTRRATAPTWCAIGEFAARMRRYVGSGPVAPGGGARRAAVPATGSPTDGEVPS